MKTFTAVAAVLLTSSTATAGQTRESLSAAAVRIAQDSAISGPEVPQLRGRDEWNKVRRLAESSVIRVVTRDGALRDGHLGYVGDDRIVLLRPAALPPDARKALLSVARTQPGFINQRAFRYKGLTVENGEIVFDGSRVADIDSVFTEIERDAVAEIKRPNGGSLLGGVLGAAGGGALGVLLAANFAFRQDGGTLMVVSLIGTPVAGAVLGARLTPHDKWTTVYRRR